MNELAISAHELGKRYRLGRVESGFRRARRLALRRPSAGHIWALRDVTFDVPEGSALAIVGKNGAGKSTLLKVLARITEPTSGYVDVAGRIGALLEIGTGFSPELTGRENVFLNGTLLGMTRRDVKLRFDEIVAFAGVEKHIDTPVKWYSSGMYVRLGFAVAAYMEPDILIVDEVLSVGDAEFQKRCLGRMGVAAEEGRTVLLVSHNMQAVRRVCKDAILLEQGQMVAEGRIESVIRTYLASVESPDLGRRRWDDPGDRPGDELCRVVEVRATDENDNLSMSFFSSRPIHVTIEFDLERVDQAFTAGFDLATIDGVVVFRSYITDLADDAATRLRPGRNAIRCTIPAGLLNNGRYLIKLRIGLHWIKWIVHTDDVLQFDVIADHGESLFLNDQARPGVVAPL
ncbi:MAG TPA: ABC transporter ATP-binding protein, partial [Acidimicrobiales bacterium]|nr:ABC transporter ATP-binding protein [Acidimicrobiales bacterium]